MKLLLIEDDRRKAETVEALLRDIAPTASVVTARSYRSGRDTALRDEFDFLIVDMTLPTFDVQNGETGYKVLPFGGRELLYELLRKRKAKPCIILTQFELFKDESGEKRFDTLSKELKAALGTLIIDIIQYEKGNKAWSKKFATAYRFFANTQKR